MCGGGEGSEGKGGRGVCVECLLQLKPGLRETRNGADEFGGGGGGGNKGCVGGESCGDIDGGETAHKPTAKMAAAGSAAAPAEATSALVQYGSSSRSPAPAPHTPELQ